MPLSLEFSVTRMVCVYLDWSIPQYIPARGTYIEFSASIIPSVFFVLVDVQGCVFS